MFLTEEQSKKKKKKKKKCGEATALDWPWQPKSKRDEKQKGLVGGGSFWEQRSEKSQT